MEHLGLPSLLILGLRNLGADVAFHNRVDSFVELSKIRSARLAGVCSASVTGMLSDEAFRIVELLIMEIDLLGMPGIDERATFQATLAKEDEMKEVGGE